MGVYSDQIVPRVTDLLLGSASYAKLRRRSLSQVAGEVIELGFGSGTNLPHYPPAVTKVFGVEPSATATRLAAKRIAAAPFPVEIVGLVGQRIDLADDSVDDAVTSWTLCTIPDVGAALAEVRRVLRPGGRLHFLEHGLSDDERVARRQHRWDGMQQRLAGGCHLDRPHDELIRGAGFELEDLATFRIAGPKVTGFMYAGRAAPV